MQLRVYTEYAIQILRVLAIHEPDGQPIGSIVKELNIPYSAATQIAVKMTQADLLDSVQGRNGGYRLGRPAAEISVYDVYRCFEGELQISHYLLKDRQDDIGEEHDGKLRTYLQDLQEKMIAEMSSVSIADIAKKQADEHATG